MKKLQSVLGIFVMLGMAMGLSFAGAFIPTAPMATYGSTPLPDTTIPATWVLLSSLNGALGTTIVPGTTVLTFQGTGDLCYFPTCPASSPEINTNSFANPFVGGFTATSGSTSFITTGLPAANTGPSGSGGTNDWLATFANQFFVNSSGSLSVTVPSTALWVVFVVRDGHYGDNSNPNGDPLGINVGLPAATPEPATYGMMLAGLGGLLALRRFRRS